MTSLDWLWRDPKRITHRVFDQPAHTHMQRLTRVIYETACGTILTVDDINPQTKARAGTPTCLRCAISRV